VGTWECREVGEKRGVGEEKWERERGEPERWRKEARREWRGRVEVDERS